MLRRLKRFRRLIARQLMRIASVSLAMYALVHSPSIGLSAIELPPGRQRYHLLFVINARIYDSGHEMLSYSR